jgi:hypothetical protein
MPRVGGPADAVWQFLIDIDPTLRLKMRMRQKLYLARYGRVGIFDWEERELSELDAYFKALSDMLAEESPVTHGSEELV